VVEHLLCEPVELTEVELDAVSGGLSFSIGISSSGSTDSASITFILKSYPTTVIENAVDNSIHIS
jgi:hypothetical protein